MPVLQPRAGKAWKDTAREVIHRLEDEAPKGYDGHKVAPYRAPQTGAGPPWWPHVYRTRSLDLITMPFDFKGRRVLVKLTRLAFVDLVKALRDVPVGIEVGFGSGYFASWRSYSMQKQLYDAYKRGGPLAAPPGRSYHHRCAVDLGVRTEEGRAAMLAHGFHDLLPQDEPHFNRLVRG